MFTASNFTQAQRSHLEADVLEPEFNSSKLPPVSLNY